jgi:hypothetical protein
MDDNATVDDIADNNTNDNMDAITFAVNNININDDVELNVKSSTSNHKLIMLDMNGTLIHRYEYKPNQPRKYTQRPYLVLFFRFLFRRYKVGIWTSGKESNMRPIAKAIFGNYYKQLTYEWYRDQCDLRPTEEKPWNTIKDMNKLKGKFKSVIMIDDSKEKIVSLDETHTHYEISTFIGDMDDHALLDIMSELS